MRQIAYIAALIVVFFATMSTINAAFAQNQSQIDTVLNGSKNCPGCNLFQAPFAYMELQDANFAGARLIQASFTVTILTRANLAGADLSHADMFGVVLTRANLTGTNFTDANLTGSWLLNANMYGADLSGTVLSGARMETAGGLTQSQLNQACGDEATSLPRGLTIPRCR